MARCLLVLGLCVLTACTTAAPPAPRTEEGPEDFVVGTTEALGSTDPAECYDAFCAYVLLANTHEGLTRIDPGSMEPVGDLAEEWEVSADGTTYTFTLHEGVRFHDGSRFDAEAMRDSLERVRDLGSGDARFLLHDDGGIERVEATSPDTLRIVLSEPDAAFPAKLAFPVAAAVPSGTPADPEDPPPGTGPYAVADISDGEVLLEAHDHRDGAPSEERIRIRRAGSAAELRGDTAAGDVHLAIRRWEAAELTRLRDTPGVEVLETDDVTLRFLAFTVSHGPYDDRDLRRAVAAAVDRERLTGGPLEGTGTPLRALLPRAFPASEETFTGGDPDAPSGVGPLDLWYTPTHYGAEERAVAEALAETLEEAGFDVDLRSAAWSDLKGSLFDGTLGGMVLLGWYPDALDPAAGYLTPLLGSDGSTALGVGYSSERMDELLAEQRTAETDEERAEVLAEIQELAASDVPVVPLWLPKRYVVVHEGVTGLEPGPSPVRELRGVSR